MTTSASHPLLLLLLGLLAMAALIGVSVLISLSEISFAAARETRMRTLAEKGNPRAAAFLKLRRNSGQVMTTIQICLNAVGVLGGVIGESMLSVPFADGLAALGMRRGLADQIGSFSAFILVTGLFVLFADLLPKRVAMNAPDKVALEVCWFPALALKLLYPAVWVFTHVSDAILKFLRIPATPTIEVMTPEDLRATLAAGTASGVLLAEEHQMIQNVMALQTRSVTSAMTPRDEIVYLDLQESLESQRDKVQAKPYSRYPLCEGGLDRVIGSIRAEDVLVAVVDEPSVLTSAPQPARNQIFKRRRNVLSLPDTLNLWETLAQFDTHGAGFALIINEYGLVVGLITYKDIMGALMDGLANPFEEQAIVKRDDHSWLIDGAAPIGDVIRDLEMPLHNETAHFDTIGGFVTNRLRRMARKADRVEVSGFRFEVVDVEGFRINQLLVTKMGEQTRKNRRLPLP
ncbi:hemolysin family protein [Oecophyllibacter saccharovorans]|uniref:Polyamine export protein n=1 Tax=Oecophyllibacter saccharovorans TaxID=2558360 RepID=A0A506UR51_9PROT|nr:hemolysin family protein [Oecophyllibacter saccharovorans]QDH14677.1 HlyC/CorC family transporter [Oecophyllibacter saccharovorans]TPW34877.1 HlyC/CorC family transporter [Oecophyllibacter saccharovorans]TPW35814.1 HlyC/CorC family transporter [Oecophyllibacter saccharovorans]